MSEPLKRRLGNKRRLIFAAFVFVTLPCLMFAAALWSLPRWLLVCEDHRVASDFIVVLGGEDSRAVTAARYFHEGVAPRVLVSGYGDASRNRDILISLGVPAEAILVEPLSRSTFQNASCSAPLLRSAGARKVTLVTSWYHSARAFAAFHRAAPEISFACLSVGFQADRVANERNCARVEVVKRAWYFVRYGILLF